MGVSLTNDYCYYFRTLSRQIVVVLCENDDDDDKLAPLSSMQLISRKILLN